MTPAPPADAGRPWYCYFWPWFIVALLATSVAAGLATAVIAYTHADEIVGAGDARLR